MVTYPIASWRTNLKGEPLATFSPIKSWVLDHQGMLQEFNRFLVQ